MAAGRIVLPPYFPARDRNARLVPGALLKVFANKTTSMAPVFADAAMATPLTNPVVANASGHFPSIWCEAGTVDAPTLYTLAVSGPDGENISNPSVFDDWQPSLDSTTAQVALTDANAQAAEVSATAAVQAHDDIVAMADSAPSGDPIVIAGKAAKSANLADLTDKQAAAANLVFLPGGSGSTARSLRDKLRETVSLKDKGALGNGSGNDAPALTAAAAMSVGVVVTPANYRFSTAVSLGSPVDIDGTNRSTSVIDASGIAGPAIDIPKWLTGGGGLRNLTVKGAATFGGSDICLSVGTNVTDNVADTLFDNLRVEGFSLGLRIRYAWDITLRQVRVQNCKKPLELGSQCNAISFDTCQFVSYTDTITLSNVEGVLFKTADMANFNTSFPSGVPTTVTPGLAAMSLFQSNAQFLNPYFEYVGDTSILVGSMGETIPSQLTIIGGVIDGMVVIGGHRSSIVIEGARWLYGDAGTPSAGQPKNIIRQPSPVAPTVYSTNLHVRLDGEAGGRDKALVSAHEFNRAKTGVEKTVFGSFDLVITRGREFSKLNSSALAEKGWQLASNLTVGTQYTLVYALRRPSAVSIASSNNGSLPAPGAYQEDTEAWEVRYMPFVAANANFGVIFDGEIEFKFVRIYKGIRNSGLDDLEQPKEWTGPAAPTTGTWRQNDRVVNDSQTVGQPKAWVCTVAGSPGTWVSEGNL